MRRGLAVAGDHQVGLKLLLLEVGHAQEHDEQKQRREDECAEAPPDAGAAAAVGEDPETDGQCQPDDDDAEFHGQRLTRTAQLKSHREERLLDSMSRVAAPE